MTPKLSEDQRRALIERPSGPVQVEDDQTHKVYVLVDLELHERAMEALRQQDDLAAIQAGIDDMEAGRIVPLEQADAEIRKDLGFAPRVS
jgi:hypothetical protein